MSSFTSWPVCWLPVSSKTFLFSYYVCHNLILIAIVIFILTKQAFSSLAWSYNELVVKFLLSSLLSKLFGFKYSEFSLAVISWSIANKNCSSFQLFFPNVRLICNVIVLGNLSNIRGTKKEPKYSYLFPKLLSAHTFLSVVSCNSSHI